MVVTSAGGKATTDDAGQFSLRVEVPLDAQSVQITAVGGGPGNPLASKTVATFGSSPIWSGPLYLAGGASCSPEWLPTFGGQPGTNGTIRALAAFDDGSGSALYAGGQFTTAGGTAANRIAKWDGLAWSALGSGMNDTVKALTVFDDGGGEALYAGGFFATAGGAVANRMAKWDGFAWSALGSGINQSVSGLTVFDDSGGNALYAGGQFTTAGGTAANNIAKWDGLAWSALGSGISSQVKALTVFDDSGGEALYAGGFFTTAGGTAANSIAKWDGLAWSALGSGLSVAVSALTVFDDGGGKALYVGGFFTTAGGTAATHIAKWDGHAWSALGSGMNSTLNALTVFDDGGGESLFVGGTGDALDSGDSFLAKWSCEGASSGCPDGVAAGSLALTVTSGCLTQPQIEVQLSMADLACPADGFGALVTFPAGVLVHRADLSSTTPAPFLINLLEVGPGQLGLSGVVPIGAPGSGMDSLLATLVFDVAASCSSAAVGFDGTGTSELLGNGIGVQTTLIDTLTFSLDSVAPVIDPVAHLFTAADAGVGSGCQSVVVVFSAPLAMDDCDGPVAVTCTPPSGSVFTVGTTAVQCTAVDTCGNQATSQFDVTVTETNRVSLTLAMQGVTAASWMRCVSFSTDTCSGIVEHELEFVNGTFVGEVEVPCGAATSLCIKDRQRSQWTTVALSLSLDGTRFEVSGPIPLIGSDTDDDGDVDINDVTLLIDQFGSAAPATTCPWNLAQRSADFNGDGVVGTLDYVYFIETWLTASSCACPVSAMASGPQPSTGVVAAGSASADLNRDGRIDRRDVQLFEQQHGLSGELSRRML